METFAFRAYDGGGRLEQGTVEAETASAALDALRRRGLFATTLDPVAGKVPAASWRAALDGGKAMPATALALVARELATLSRAGLTLEEALQIVALQPALTARIRRTVEAVLSDVRGGASISQALAARKGAFPEHFWRLVQAGEVSGSLPQVLDDLAAFLEQENRLRSQTTTALVYPAVLMVLALVTVTIVVTVMVPAIMPLFGDAGVKPPLFLAVLAGVSRAIAGSWHYLAATTGGLVLAAAWALQSDKAALLRDRLVLSIPVLGRLVLRANTARFARTMATLLRNDVPMQDALTVSAGVMINRVFRQAARHAEQEVNEGATLLVPLTTCRLFPDLALRLIALGQQSGQLAMMLARVADIYEQDVQQQLQRLLAIAVPAITVTIGGLVGGLMLSVMGAMLALNETVIR
ncbi:MAG: type II secretion system F family protein [Hyphomicrobiaceae bacterium]|nr:type II secretion system F family protein [Hyphomicrobiaceae bacterium]